MTMPERDMADQDLPGADTGLWPMRLSAMRRRLVSHRFPLAAALVLFGMLVARGNVSLPLFLALSAAMLAVCLLAPVRTVSERRRAASGTDGVRALETAPFAAALDGIPDPVLLIDRRGAVRHANLQYQRMLGAMRPGASVQIRFRSPEVLEMIQSALAGGAPGPVEFLERSPREHWFLLSISALASGADRRGGFLLHFRDLSELRRAERMRTDFIANASHELRTPLASLAGFIETLAGPARDDEGARDRFLAIMHEQAERMSRLIDDLLSLSRFETALGRSDFARVDLIDILVHVVGAFQPMAGRNDIAIALDRAALPDDRVFIHGSRDELIQLFENLVENAIKYGGDGGRVEIIATPAELGGMPATSIEVRDHGPGIESEHIPRLTERFYRVDVETSRGKQGTGLGLAIVKHIVTRHEGRLTIRSRPGEGTRVYVIFPAMVADNVDQNPEKEEKTET
ncbi:ATP-binding protein [Oceaniradius stylonematis]|jgi:two-component system, OmpR family, phosphate regulon sensor histidine kinase PhoR|uniref:ATP-binding protein n=1 Tax=Oceaniradius stylonematis TaxID=2184161 RepID=UPI00273EE4C8|nr:ATP-binding protein [Oceaniradius stylonematis]